MEKNTHEWVFKHIKTSKNHESERWELFVLFASESSWYLIFLFPQVVNHVRVRTWPNRCIPYFMCSLVLLKWHFLDCYLQKLEACKRKKNHLPCHLPCHLRLYRWRKCILLSHFRNSNRKDGNFEFSVRKNRMDGHSNVVAIRLSDGRWTGGMYNKTSHMDTNSSIEKSPSDHGWELGQLALTLAILMHYYKVVMLFIFLVLFFIPIIVTSLVYINMYIKIRSASKVRDETEQYSTEQTEQRRNNMMQRKIGTFVLILVLILIISVSPLYITVFIEVSCELFKLNYKLIETVEKVEYYFNLLAMMNHVVNPIFYAWSTSLYRQAFWKMFGRAGIENPETLNLSTIN